TGAPIVKDTRYVERSSSAHTAHPPGPARSRVSMLPSMPSRTRACSMRPSPDHHRFVMARADASDWVPITTRSREFTDFQGREAEPGEDRKSTRLNSSHVKTSDAVF